ncbi:MAG TPA: ATP-binding protein [Polyangiaceae bacterium]|nr:ATP-binding protein [Polyangiaceae bacterium]
MSSSAGRWVGWLTRAPEFGCPSVSARARLLLNVLRILIGGLATAILLATLDSRNQLRTLVVLYGPVAVCLGVAFALLRRGHLAAAGWLTSTLIFVLVTTVTVLFGGITGNNAVAYVIAVMVASTCLSRRAAVVVAVLSAGAAGFVALLEHSGRLPDPVAPITTFNAWIAVTVTLIVAAVLHNMAVSSREASLLEASQALARLREAQAENETRALHGAALADLSSSALAVSDACSFCGRATSVAASLLSADVVVYLEFDDDDRVSVACAYGCDQLPTQKVCGRHTLLPVPPRVLSLGDAGVRETIAGLGGLPTEAGLLVPVRGAYRSFGLLGALSAIERRYSRDEEQFLTTLAGIMASLIERERMLERAERAQKMEVVGRLAGGVAHDFNNLLTVMSGVSELLSESTAPGSDDAALLTDLDDAITRATLLGRQLLAVSRRQVVAPTNLDLCLLVREFLPMAKRLIGDDVTLTAQLPQGAAFAYVDQGSVEQILLNLIVNARDAMPNGGTISVAIDDRDEGSLELTVSDTGVGISESTRQRLFQPFFTTKEQGTGLGLATVADIIARIGGSIQVSSEPGAGATFRVLLPRPVETVSEDAEREGPRSSKGRRARILLAEDHDLVRANIVRMLSTSNYDVVAVSEGVEALRELETGDPFDLLVTDVTMPGLGGHQLADVIVDTEHETPILFISGHFDAATRALPEQARFLAKPFTREALLAAIAGALHRA